MVKKGYTARVKLGSLVSHSWVLEIILVNLKWGLKYGKFKMLLWKYVYSLSVILRMYMYVSHSVMNANIVQQCNPSFKQIFIWIYILCVHFIKHLLQGMRNLLTNFKSDPFLEFLVISRSEFHILPTWWVLQYTLRVNIHY